MKKEEVPQDDKNLTEGKFRDLCYAVDENGNYVQVLSSGWEPKNIVIMQAWENVNELAEKARTDFKNGKVSPLVFHMERCQMDLKLLSAYTGFSKGKIKEHFSPAEFQKLTTSELEIYADAFGIKPEEINNV